MKVLYPLLAVAILVIIPYICVGIFGSYFPFAVVIPYVAGALFIGGLIYRLVGWASSPVPFHIPTVCGQQKSLPWIKSDYIDSPWTTLGVVIRMALDIVFFRPLFMNERVELKGGKLVFGASRYLWLGALAFHWSLLIILIRHSRFFLEPVPSFINAIKNFDRILEISLPVIHIHTIFYISHIIILLALAYLFLRRIFNPQARYISLSSDYFAVLLIFAVAFSGFLMTHFYKVDVVKVKELAMSVISFKPSIPEGIGIPFYIHLFLFCSLLAYFPYSKMAHAMGIFLSPTRNLMNNSRMVRHVNPWDYPVKIRTYAEYEDEFRDRMKKVGLPLEKEV